MTRKIKIIFLTTLALICAVCTFFAACGSVPDEKPAVAQTTVYFYNGDELVYTDTGYVKRDIVMPANPQKDGYEFKGWFTDDEYHDKITQRYLQNYDYRHETDFNVYAEFDAITYRITYKIDDEFVTENETLANPDTYNIESETTLLPLTKTAQGYTFDGWYDGNKKITALKGNFGDKKLVAHFNTNIKQYEIGANNKLYFGSYPQTRVTETALTTTLNNLAGKTPTVSNARGWTSYGFAHGNNNTVNPTAFIWYKDVKVDGIKYRGVYFNAYRPESTGMTGNTATETIQNNNGYAKDAVYWFKWEKIEWNILNGSGGNYTVMTDKIIDARELTTGSPDSNQTFNTSGNYWGWYYSSTRKWLNSDFIDAAFNIVLYSTNIKTGNRISNAHDTTGINVEDGANTHSGAGTSDTVYLCSNTEITAAYSTNEARVKGYTDYAACLGLKTEGQTAQYWLRSHSYMSEARCGQAVNADGSIDVRAVAEKTFYGIAPVAVVKNMK